MTRHDLAQEVAQEIAQRRAESLAADSPDMRLFEHRALHRAVRSWAYSERRRYTDLPTWQEAVRTRAEATQAVWGVNRMVSPEITEQIALEVAGWVWDHLDGSRGDA